MTLPSSLSLISFPLISETNHLRHRSGSHPLCRCLHDLRDQQHTPHTDLSSRSQAQRKEPARAVAKGASGEESELGEGVVEHHHGHYGKISTFLVALVLPQ